MAGGVSAVVFAFKQMLKRPGVSLCLGCLAATRTFAGPIDKRAEYGALCAYEPENILAGSGVRVVECV